MRITIYAIGKQKQGPYTPLIETYLSRIPLKLKILELEVKKNLEEETLKKAEAHLLLTQIKPEDYVIALDERGKNITSPSFSELLFKPRYAREIAFIIGGAYGLDPCILQRADFILSFGKLVWPHQMVRVMLIEQIYRAYTIHKGHPYHK